MNTQNINNSNIESKNNNQEFFTNGKKYRCIKSVVTKKGGETAFKAGKVYEQSCEPTHWVGWLRNEQGERHGWPQLAYIPQEVKTWGTKPEDIDPRLYFEPVENTKDTEDIREAEPFKVGDMVRHNQSNEVAKVVGIRKGNSCALGLVTLYKLDFGKSVKGAFGYELNGGEFVAEALSLYDGSKIGESGRTEYYRHEIADAAQLGLTKSLEHGRKKITARAAYTNGHNNPEGWTYCVCWYEGVTLKECENGISLDQAACAFSQWEKEEKGRELQSMPTSWATDYSADDFHKLHSLYEISDEDRDIVGRRFRISDIMGEDVEVFISDYAGNERYALCYTLFEGVVRAKVRSLDFLRQIYTKEKGWKMVS